MPPGWNVRPGKGQGYMREELDRLPETFSLEQRVPCASEGAGAHASEV
jgi:hypothetical protein